MLCLLHLRRYVCQVAKKNLESFSYLLVKVAVYYEGFATPVKLLGCALHHNFDDIYIHYIVILTTRELYNIL